MHTTNIMRQEKAESCASKMAQALSEAWLKGERALVISTIRGGMNAQVREQWQRDTADALPPEKREEFYACTAD